jgi:hypothetical protein
MAIVNALGIDIRRYAPDSNPRCVTLSPASEPKGRVLLAYILDPFLAKPGQPVSTNHTHHSESVLIAETWLKHGYSIDVIDYRNDKFIPREHYAFFVSARTNLEVIAKRLNSDCIKIAHLDTSHYTSNNHASYNRLLDLQRRRGLSLPGSARFVEPNRAIDNADYGVVLGNAVTAATYQYANKPLFTLNVPSTVDRALPGNKDFSVCRNHFLWFGSGGMVHKGLDITLEAFSGMPDMRLTICGPVAAEKEFERAYQAELYEISNIRTLGWVDVASAEFARIVNECVAIIYPSCAEGQAGSVIMCLRAGLLPIATCETGLDVHDFGWLLSDISVEGIRRSVRAVAAMPSTELESRSRRAWNYAAEYHGQEAYARRYAEIIATITAGMSNT